MPRIDHIYYEEAGAGRPVILIHCPALSHIYWRPVMDRLSQVSRCIAFDIRGHGRSGKREEPWDFREIAADIALLTERLKLKQPVLVGYSSGASIAVRAVLDHPDTYGGVVMVSGFSECTTMSMKAKVGIGLLGVRLGLVGMIGPNIIGTNSVGKAHTQAMLPHAKGVSPRALRSFFESTLRCNFTQRLHEVKVPVLLVYGGKDEWMHRYYRILREGLPHARTLFFPNTDHRIPTRRPDDFADAVAEFLVTLEPPAEDQEPLVLPPAWHAGPVEHQLHDTNPAQ